MIKEWVRVGGFVSGFVFVVSLVGSHWCVVS